MMPPEEPRVTEQVRCDLTRDEARDRGQMLARENQAVFDLRRKKKQVNADLAAAILRAEAQIADLTERINQNYEMRDAECYVVLNEPRRGVKTLFRADTRVPVRELPMSFAELQQEFPFEERKEDDESQPFKRKKDVN